MLDLLIDLMIEIFFNCSDYFHKCVFLNGNFSYPKGTGDYHEAVKNHICTEFSPGIAIPTMFENKTKFVVADFDYHNTGSNDYNRSEILASLNEFKKSYCVPFSIELSKRGGIHVWVFFEEPTDKADAYRTMFVLLQKAGLNNKKSFDKIIPYKEQIGLCPTIHLPFDAYFRNHGHTCFLNDDMLPITSTEEYVEFLRNIKKAKPEDVKFDDIIHLPNDLEVEDVENVNAQNIFSSDSEKIYTTEIHLLILRDGYVKTSHGQFDLKQIYTSEFFKWCIFSSSEVGYIDWVALITNLLPLGEIGETLIHLISKMDGKRYDFKKTEAQIMSAKSRNLHPFTFEYILKSGNFKSIGTVKVKSPVVELLRRDYEHISYPLTRVLSKPIFKDQSLLKIFMKIIVLENQQEREIQIAYKTRQLKPGEIYISQRELAKQTNVPKTTLQRKIKILEQAEILNIEKIHRKIIIKISASYFHPQLGQEVPLFVVQPKKWEDI